MPEVQVSVQRQSNSVRNVANDELVRKNSFLALLTHYIVPVVPNPFLSFSSSSNIAITVLDITPNSIVFSSYKKTRVIPK